MASLHEGQCTYGVSKNYFNMCTVECKCNTELYKGYLFNVVLF